MPQSSWIVAAGGLAAFFVPAVNGHLYTVESRQYYNSAVYQEESYPNYERWAGAYNAGGQVEVQKRAKSLTDPTLLAEYGDGFYPLRWVYDKGEMAPNGNYLEPEGISVRHGVCGDPRSGDQGGKDGDNVYSTPNKDWPILSNYTQGQVIEIKAIMKAHHWGHLEFFICDANDLTDPDGVVTQECFNKYPLTRAEGDGVNSPIDPNHSGRYYVDPPCRKDETDQEYDWRAGGGYVMTMNYQLPADLTCERCVLQTWYFTGHKCYHPGYKEFNPPSWPSQCAPNKEDWIDLTIDQCGDKNWILAEEFWQCNDMSIKAGGSTPPTTNKVTPESTPEPTPEPTPEASPEPTPEPTPQPTPEPSPEATTEPTEPLVMPVAPPTPEPAMPVAQPTTATTEPPVDVETPEPAMPVAQPTTATTEPPVDVETPEPTMDPATMKPATPVPVGEEAEEYEALGCFHDNEGDRVLGDRRSSTDMTTKACFDYCTELGANFMATQYGFECWCSSDGGLDYNRHYDLIGEDAVCDMPCEGDETEICGGFNSFELYRLAPALLQCSTPSEAYEQCAGLDWTGSTCCGEGYQCVDVSGEGCYSQCRPVSTEETTPAPMANPVPEEPVQVAPIPEPTSPPVAEPETAPTVPAQTPEPVAPTPTPPTPGMGAPADMQEMLDLHNKARCIHNADPLTWSSEVEASAAVHAKRMSDACGGLFHSASEERNGYGENIFWCGGSHCYSAESAMNGFYEDEIQTDSVTSYGGHATQILWKSTEKLGCAISSCSDGVYLACQYDPPGNYGGMYEEEVELPTNAGNC